MHSGSKACHVMGVKFILLHLLDFYLSTVYMRSNQSVHHRPRKHYRSTKTQLEIPFITEPPYAET